MRAVWTLPGKVVFIFSLRRAVLDGGGVVVVGNGKRGEKKNKKKPGPSRIGKLENYVLKEKFMQCYKMFSLSELH